MAPKRPPPPTAERTTSGTLLLVRDVPELGRLVGQAVHGQPHEVTEHDLEDRAQTGDRRPERGSREGQLGDRGVEDPLLAEALVQLSGVAMKTPPAAATSSPKKITDSSRAISSASASRIAARNSSLS